MFWIQASEGVEAIDDMGWWIDPRLSSRRKAPHHHQVGTSWSPPPTGEFKFNVNSSAKGKLGLAGCGGVLQDSDGNVVGLFFYPIGLHDSNFAELMAILKALKLFAATPYTSSPLIIEFDSRVALSWVNSVENGCGTNGVFLTMSTSHLLPAVAIPMADMPSFVLTN
ncbi:Ribonuclease H domain - like 10 [Theobroma cacao]|nr:Ribonuclease H domain - like 10 [Theobroma cacao]